MNAASAPAWLALLLAACGGGTDDRERTFTWLAAAQDADGLWRSQTYGLLARGESTTATLALAIALLPDPARERCRGMAERALAALARRQAPSPAAPPEPIDYPVYTAAHRLHALAVLRPEGWREQADALIAFLAHHQLGERLGWRSDDPPFGGFGLGDREHQKPLGADLVGLSATTSVLEALAAAGVGRDHAMVRAARTFVERCQDFGTPDADGGFCFAPTGDWRGAKAGLRRTSDGRERPVSYGTATADGIRALLASGDGPGSPRVRAALDWLLRHAATAAVPGFGTPVEPDLESSLRLYWLQACARAVSAAGHDDGALRAALAQALRRHERPDGSYVGVGMAMKEDDPLVATALALLALGALARH